MSIIKHLTEIEEVRSYVGDKILRKSAFEGQLVVQKNDLEETKKNLIGAQEAQMVLKETARETQSEIEEHLSSVVTLGLSAVEVDDDKIPKPPQFLAKMVDRRGTTECDLLFKEGNREQHPLDSSGYGYVDIADYVLRIGYILLEEEYCDYEVRKTLLSDEPLRNVDPALQFKVSEMLQMISEDLGFQQIIVSHAKGVNIKAESSFGVVKEGKISKVTKNE